MLGHLDDLHTRYLTLKGRVDSYMNPPRALKRKASDITTGGAEDDSITIDESQLADLEAPQDELRELAPKIRLNKRKGCGPKFMKWTIIGSKKAALQAFFAMEKLYGPSY